MNQSCFCVGPRLAPSPDRVRSCSSVRSYGRHGRVFFRFVRFALGRRVGKATRGQNRGRETGQFEARLVVNLPVLAISGASGKPEERPKGYASREIRPGFLLGERLRVLPCRVKVKGRLHRKSRSRRLPTWLPGSYHAVPSVAAEFLIGERTTHLSAIAVAASVLPARSRLTARW